MDPCQDWYPLRVQVMFRYLKRSRMTNAQAPSVDAAKVINNRHDYWVDEETAAGIDAGGTSATINLDAFSISHHTDG